MRRALPPLAFLLLLLTGAAAAAQGIQVLQAWARAPAGGGPAALYVTLHNAGSADRLTSVSTDAAGMAMLHQSAEVGGVDTMRDLPSVALPAGGTVTMHPGGIHVMLMDLNRPLHAGGALSVTLTFAHAPPVTVSVPILPPGAPGPR